MKWGGEIRPAGRASGVAEGERVCVWRNDARAFPDHVERDWCFVVAEIGSSETSPDGGVVSAGLAAPLIMRFKTDAVVYPLVLTSLRDRETQVLIYTFGKHRLACDDRMEILWAGKPAIGPHSLFGPHQGTELGVESFFRGKGRAINYLCAFQGTLTPEQMREDFHFERASNDTPHRKQILRC